MIWPKNRGLWRLLGACLAGRNRVGAAQPGVRAALAYAEAATDPAKRVDDACFARLRANFDEQAILDLTALVAFQNLSSKFNAALAVPAQGVCATSGREPRR